MLTPAIDHQPGSFWRPLMTLARFVFHFKRCRILTPDKYGCLVLLCCQHQVNVYRYPCTQISAEASIYTGHSSHVTCARWVSRHVGKQQPRDEFLVTTGGEDKCVFQWRCISADNDTKTSGSSVSPNESHAVESGFDDILDSAPVGGDEFTAVKVSSNRYKLAL